MFIAKREGAVHPKIPSLLIYFQGYSNAPDGQPIAVFSVTNQDSCDVVLWNKGLVGFSPPPAATSPVVQVSVAYNSLCGLAIRPGHSYRMQTDVPRHNSRWNITWKAQRLSLANQMAGITSRLPSFLPRYNNGSPDLFVVSTDWIEKDCSTNRATE